MAPTTQSLSVWDGRITTRVHTAGSGDPVVFLHGAGGLEWDPFLDGLAERFTVHAPEHPGTTPGDPDGIKALDHLWDLVLYYDELFDALGVDAPAVIGHSFGGMVAAEVAATFRRRVSKLVLLNALGLWRDDAPIPNFLVMTPDEFVPLMVADQSGPLAQRFLTPPDMESEAGQTAVTPDDVVAGVHRQVLLADPGSRAGHAHPPDHRADAGRLGPSRQPRQECLRGRVRPPDQRRPSRGPRERRPLPPRSSRPSARSLWWATSSPGLTDRVRSALGPALLDLVGDLGHPAG